MRHCAKRRPAGLNLAYIRAVLWGIEFEVDVTGGSRRRETFAFAARCHTVSQVGPDICHDRSFETCQWDGTSSHIAHYTTLRNQNLDCQLYGL